MNDKYNKKEPLLFIYIPSYNRFSYLELQLDKLTKQIDLFKGQVRVLVSNNNSNDGDYTVIAEKYRSYPIEFRYNPGNIGANANITLGFTFARENEFLWILSDDDRISPFALDSIFSALDDTTDILHIGMYSESVKKNLRLSNLFTLPKGAGFGLISVGILNMNFFRQYIIHGFDYLDSSFPHLAIIMAALRDKNSALMATVRHDLVFSGEVLETHGSGDYAISSVGFGYLADFFPKNFRRQFLWTWLRGGWIHFLNARKLYKNKYDRALGYLFLTSPTIYTFLVFMRVLVKIRQAIQIFKRKLTC